MEKESLQILIEEFKANWTYYNKTLDERKNLFDWFLKIVGLPAAGIGLVLKYDPLSIESQYYAYIFFLIAIIGLALFLTYIKETSNSKGYLWSNNLIRQTFRDNYEEVRDKLTADQYKDQYEWLGKIIHWRSSLFIIINSAIVFIGSSILNDQASCKPWFFLIGMIALQILMFLVFIKSYQFNIQKKNDG